METGPVPIFLTRSVKTGQTKASSAASAAGPQPVQHQARLRQGIQQPNGMPAMLALWPAYIFKPLAWLYSVLTPSSGCSGSPQS